MLFHVVLKFNVVTFHNILMLEKSILILNKKYNSNGKKQSKSVMINRACPYAKGAHNYSFEAFDIEWWKQYSLSQRPTIIFGSCNHISLGLLSKLGHSSNTNFNI